MRKIYTLKRIKWEIWKEMRNVIKGCEQRDRE